LRVEEIHAQAEVAEARKTEIDERIQNFVDLIEALDGEMGIVEGETQARESSWSRRVIEKAPRAEVARYENDRKALVRTEEDIKEEIDRLKIDLEEAEAAKEVAQQRCQVLEDALKEAQRVYALVVDMVGRPDLNLSQSIVAYVDNRRLRWGGIVGMCIGPLILYALPPYLGVMYQMVSADSSPLRIATLIGLVIPVWFAFDIRRLERAGLPCIFHFVWEVGATAVIFLVCTLLSYKMMFWVVISRSARNSGSFQMSIVGVGWRDAMGLVWLRCPRPSPEMRTRPYAADGPTDPSWLRGTRRALPHNLQRHPTASGGRAGSLWTVVTSVTVKPFETFQATCSVSELVSSLAGSVIQTAEGRLGGVGLGRNRPGLAA
jgi:hypothetical protein